MYSSNCYYTYVGRHAKKNNYRTIDNFEIMKLNKVTIHKYKCIETEQQFVVEDDISILVGMNESGKTSVLEAIAKSNYFQKDEAFKFKTTHDYPRKEKKTLDKSGLDPNAITAEYE